MQGTPKQEEIKQELVRLTSNFGNSNLFSQKIDEFLSKHFVKTISQSRDADEARAFKKAIEENVKFQNMEKVLDAKIEKLNKYHEDHNQHVTSILLSELKQVKDAKK